MLSDTWQQIHTSWVQKIAHLDLHLCFLTASVTNKYTQQHSRISVQSLHCGCTNKSNLLGTCMWVCPWRTASSRADPPNRSLQNFRCHQAIVINHSKFRDAHFFLKSESIRRCLQFRSALFSKRNSTMFWCPSDEARCWNAQTSQRYLWMAPHYGRSESEDQSRGPSPAPFFCRSQQNWQRLRFQPVSSPRLSCHHKQPVNMASGQNLENKVQPELKLPGTWGRLLAFLGKRELHRAGAVRRLPRRDWAQKNSLLSRADEEQIRIIGLDSESLLGDVRSKWLLILMLKCWSVLVSAHLQRTASFRHVFWKQSFAVMSAAAFIK